MRSHLALTVDQQAAGARNRAHVGALDIRRDAVTPSVASEILRE